MAVELLAPAGDIEKLRWAAAYGADAVYFGCEFGSLRSFAGNFSFADAEAGLNYLHERGKRGYCTLNIYPFTDEYDKVVETAKRLDDMGVDAFIIADMGVFNEVKKLGLRADIHVSTQANTMSAQSARAYGELGAKRVNLARELSFEQICEITEQVGGCVEAEVFVHGAVCFSYSGRCAISDYMTGYRANRGECKHPCRWNYGVVEEKRPGEFYPVYEDERGHYIFNSKDLALFEFVGGLKDAGVRSFKIEGRMKSIHYIASVVWFYRQVLDGKVFSEEEGLGLLRRVPNRGYSKGFMKGGFGVEDYEFEVGRSRGESRFVGNVVGKGEDGGSVVEVRNKICAGDELEVLRPGRELGKIKMGERLVTRAGAEVDFVNHSQFIRLDEVFEEFTVLRRVLGND